MSQPSWMSNADWSKVRYYAGNNGIYPELLAAIGWHETQWGRLGWGRSGFHLGVGCYSDANGNYAYQGLEKQLAWAAPRLGRYLGTNVTKTNLYNFAREVWRPGNPVAWEASVYEIYTDLRTPTTSDGQKSADGRAADLNISVEHEVNNISLSVSKINDVLRNFVRNNS